MNARRCVTAVVVTYNSAETIARCVMSLHDTAPAWIDRVIVVDNSSSDNTVSVLKALDGDLTILTNERNFGFGAACNRGARGAATDYLLFLNPDAALEPNCLAELVRFLDAREAASCCGPRIQDETGRPDPAARRGFPTPWNALGRLFFVEKLFPRSRWFASYSMPWLGYEREVRVDTILGACMLVRRSAFDRIGGFDEDYFLFGEDIDLCKRFSDLKLESWFVPTARLLHRGGHSMKSETRVARREFYRAMRIYMSKHWRDLPTPAYRLIEMGIGLRALVDRLIGH
ncbi:MAG: glycosyltransferase family 2 protein [bacterium]|nr:glycosyltransferase family 2 protein [bacterium]